MILFEHVGFAPPTYMDVCPPVFTKSCTHAKGFPAWSRAFATSNLVNSDFQSYAVNDFLCAHQTFDHRDASMCQCWLFLFRMFIKGRANLVMYKSCLGNFVMAIWEEQHICVIWNSQMVGFLSEMGLGSIRFPIQDHQFRFPSVMPPIRSWLFIHGAKVGSASNVLTC